MKKFVAPCSFPSISINIRKVVVFNDANFQDFSKKLVNMSTKNTRGSYRSRNRFMVTRNLLCRLVKQETALSSTDVSKVVSLVRHQFIFSKAHILNQQLWKRSSYALRNYFEYISILESFWYEKLILTYGNSLSGSLTPSLQCYRSYLQLCSSSYCSAGKQAKAPGNQSFAPSKFRVHKEFRNQKKSLASPKSRTQKIDSLNTTFRINKCCLTASLGIVTEDMFLHQV